MTNSIRRLVIAIAWSAVATAALSAAAPIRLGHQRLDLGGAPAAQFSIDLDHDGRRDLALVVASTEWGQIGIEEQQEIDELGAYVEVLTVVPALFDRRELVVHLGLGEGGFASEPLRLELEESVHALFEGPHATPLLAWTDEGIAVVEIRDGALVLQAAIAAPSPIAGSRTFLSDLRLTRDLDGDGERDLLLPVETGYAVHLSGAEGLSATPAARFGAPLEERLPGDERHYRRGSLRHLPIPEVLDLDGDGLPELVFRNHDQKWNEMRVLRNLGGGRFGPPIDPLDGRDRDADPEVVWMGDLDGEGGAELVTEEELEPESDSMRAEMAYAKRPRIRYSVHVLEAGLVWNPMPRRRFEAEGYIFEGGSEVPLPLGVRDLDGDGRADLVAMSLDFSMIQALRVLAARSIRLGLEFEPLCQQADGSFRAVPNPELGGKFTLRLEQLRLPQLSSFSGDFDGDGRADFLQLGRGRRVVVRRGAEGCSYPESGETTIELAAEPADLALVRVEDLDGDGRSDLAVTQPPPRGEPGGRGSLDLYLSGVAP
jgi:FG-GAP-like repeat